MAKNAVLKQAYSSSGLCIDGGGSFSLPRLVGTARALEIAAFDAPIGAELALQWGLATKLANEGEAVQVACEMAHDLASRAVGAFGMVKRLFNESGNTTRT
jgi:2-(1,2-epoxy-1,2-dihydrophenyl)acetyl-CoA isomerase